MLTAEQTQARMRGIGGSDAAVVCGLSPFKSLYQLYLEKRGEAPPDEDETLNMKFGSLLEEPIVSHYCDVTGRLVRRQPLAVHDRYPFMLANIDRQILKDSRGPGILEVKTTNDWSGRGIVGRDDIPDHYYLQAQHYLAVYEYDWASIAILIGTSRFVWFDIERNDDVIDELIRQEGAFWERVQAGEPPEVDGSARTAELLKRLYPRDTGKRITATAPELFHAALQLSQAKAAMKEAEDAKDHFENQIKSAMGDASEMALDGWGTITWKRAKDSTVDKLNLDKLKAQYPEAYAACLEREVRPGSRRLVVKPLKEVA